MPSLTITLDAANAARVSVAVRRRLSLDHDATLAEVKDFLVTYLKHFVKDQERAAAQEAVTTEIDLS